MFNLIEKNKKIAKITLIILLIIPVFYQILLSTLPLHERFFYIIMSLLILLISNGSMFLILGKQIYLKILSKKALSAVCNFFLIIGIIIVLFQYINLINIGFINTKSDIDSIISIYWYFGPIVVSYIIKDKYLI